MRRILIILAVLAVLLASLAALWVATRADGEAVTGAGGQPPAAGAGGEASGGGTGASAASTAAPSAAPGSAGTATRALPPALGLRRVAGAYTKPLFATARRADPRRLYVVQKDGVIRVVRDGKLLSRPFLNLNSRVSTVSERGLLSLAFDPRYTANRFVYVYYTDLNGTIRVVRYRTFNADRVDLRTARTLLSVAHPAGNHNGGQLAFGPDGLLYVGTGDGGGAGDAQGNAQNQDSRLGKLLTVDVRAATPTAGMYASGLRNPWRFSFDRRTGDLWIGDVGQDAWEEIDHLPAATAPGSNFGWNAYEGTHDFQPQTIDRSRLKWPVFEYSHALGESVTGGYVYRGRAIPALRGWYLFADFVSGRVWAMKGTAAAPVRISLGRRVPSISSFGEGAGGELYVVSLAGAVYRIVAR